MSNIYVATINGRGVQAEAFPREIEYASIYRKRSGQDAGEIDYGIDVASVERLSHTDKLELVKVARQLAVALERYCGTEPPAALEIHTTPLTLSEQDDLFQQMEKRLSKVGVQPANLLACEMENIYRMRATILQLRKSLEWAERSIGAYEQKGQTIDNPRESNR